MHGRIRHTRLAKHLCISKLAKLSPVETTGQANMDIQDLQDNLPADLQLVEITEKIIGCAFEVNNELGTGFLESVYEKALAIDLREKGFQVQCQHAFESFSELKSSCISCPSMFIYFVRKLMLRCL
jgi:hypothetical protein